MGLRRTNKLLYIVGENQNQCTQNRIDLPRRKTQEAPHKCAFFCSSPFPVTQSLLRCLSANGVLFYPGLRVCFQQSQGIVLHRYNSKTQLFNNYKINVSFSKQFQPNSVSAVLIILTIVIVFSSYFNLVKYVKVSKVLCEVVQVELSSQQNYFPFGGNQEIRQHEDMRLQLFSDSDWERSGKDKY